MGAWGERMQCNDTALDAIDNLKEWGNSKVLSTIKEKGIDYILKLDNNSHSILGVAEWLMDQHIDLSNNSLILNTIQSEKSQIKDWTTPTNRLDALNLFEQRVKNQPITPDQQSKIDQFNMGLFDRIAKDLK